MIKKIAFAVCVLTLLSSCGYRGALYLPSEKEQTPATDTTQDEQR